MPGLMPQGQAAPMPQQQAPVVQQMMQQQRGPAMPDGAQQQQPSPGSGAGGQEDTTNVTPEEQDAYNRFVANGHLAIYSDQTFDRVRQSLSSDQPAEALAMTAATIVKQLIDSARQNGMQFDGAVLLHGGEEIFEELADLQADAGIADLNQEQLDGAWYRALDLFRSMSEADGSLNMQTVQQDMQTLMAADQQGQLDQIIPGASRQGAPAGGA